MLTTSASWPTGCRTIDLDRMICEPYLPPCSKVARQVTSTVQFAAISETTRPRRGLRSHDHVLGLLTKQRGEEDVFTRARLHHSSDGSGLHARNESMKVLAVSGCRHSEHMTFTFDTMLRSLVICFGMDGSFLPVSNVSSMPINLSLLPEPIASCPSLATKAQNPSNHCTQQLPEVPPTNSDDTIPIAPRPPSSLTTELEPAARPQVPRNH